MNLRERKQQRARDAIVEAAYDLFAERGFTQVTVSDIAARAEVGRTTFFRWFGDKQEVLFADEQGVLDTLAAVPADGPVPGDPREAIRQLWEVTVEFANVVIGDPARYTEHERLIAGNPELQDRANRKLQRIAEALYHLLVARGAAPDVAATASELAIACYRAARRIAGDDPEALLPAMKQTVDLLWP